MNKIKLYSSPVCPYCVALKNFLKEKEITFEEIDVSQDEKAAQEVVEKTGQTGIPVIDIDGEIVIGFDRAKIVKLLGIKD